MNTILPYSGQLAPNVPAIAAVSQRSVVNTCYTKRPFTPFLYYFFTLISKFFYILLINCPAAKGGGRAWDYAFLFMYFYHCREVCCDDMYAGAAGPVYGTIAWNIGQ
jgi:hypothetical protein